jgi:hypothetical protein
MPTQCLSSTALQKKRGTANMTPTPSASSANFMPSSQASSSAPTGREPKDARTSTIPLTPAPAAAQPTTELKAALEHRGGQALTPYKPEAWEAALRQANLLERFGNIPIGLQFGFRVDFPNIIHTQSPRNSPSLDTYHSEFREIVQKEISKGRYIGPFPIDIIQSVIGPFQSSPLSIIPKPGRPGKFRLVQNFSFPIAHPPPTPIHPLIRPSLPLTSPPRGENSPSSSTLHPDSLQDQKQPLEM